MPNNSTTISGLSYTNKDFNSIYAELLDLVKTLTNKWDPSISNESDPGVVLIKLGALLADKDNYNCDKNILELFPQSVSQYGNARKIYDIAGYSMKWYMSAITDVNFNYSGNDVVSPNVITLKALDTMVSDESGEVVYTLLEDVTLHTISRYARAQCIQGVINQYEVNGVDTITLDNLDEYNRIYFNETMIAENGIFVANNTGSNLNYIGDWERVDNLESRPLGSKIFKFGVLPNSDTCYLEFPQDIVNLISGGLKIRYITTSGSAGNVSSNTLTTFYSSDINVEVKKDDGSTKTINVTDQISINNPYAAVDGTDYEDLDSAYNNYKDIVGTFNTLVTCKDYETAVNDVMDGRNYAASNCVVSDRTNDINNSRVIMQRTSSGTNEVIDSGDMNAFSIGMYALCPMNNTVNAYYYNKSFSVNDNMEYIKNNQQNGIVSYKSIQHDYIDTTPLVSAGNPAIPYIYKNIYKLTGTVSTYYKVSSTDATEIENNIRTALYRKFNARNIDFGVEIEYDDIVDTIVSADSRIKYVNLNQPEYVFRVMMSNDLIGSAENSRVLTPAQQVDILCKMITAGNIQLYNFNHDFAYDFGQTSSTIYPTDDTPITSITTKSEIATVDIPDSEGKYLGKNGYTVKKNENIILYTASLVSQISYTGYVNISLQKASQSAEEINISANNYYVLRPDEVLYVNYVDTNNVTQNISYRNGTIIRPNFDLSSEASRYKIEKTVPAADGSGDITISFMMISASQQIDIMEENKTEFSPGLNCLWFTLDRKTGSTTKDGTQQITYTLFNAVKKATETTQERLLQNNEYFIYTNADRNELVMLTSGTKIVRTLQEGKDYPEVSCTNLLNAGDITSSGQSAVGDNDWVTWLSSWGDLSVHEQSIVTLGEGSLLKGTFDKGVNSISNDPVIINNPSYGTSSSTAASGVSWTNLPIVDLGEATNDNFEWHVMSRLVLSAGSDTAQELSAGQSITFNDDEQPSIEGGENINIMLNIPLTLAGGNNMDVTSTSEDGTVSAPLKIYKFTSADVMIGNSILARNEDGYMRIPASGSGVELPFAFGTDNANAYYLIPIIKSLSGNNLSIAVDAGTIKNYVGGELSNPTVPEVGAITPDSIKNAGTYYLLIDGVATKLTVTWKAASGSQLDTTDFVLVGNIYKVYKTDTYSDVVTETINYINQGLEEDERKSAADLFDAITAVQTAAGGVIFDYTYEVNELDSLDFTVVKGTTQENNALAPKMMWDINHVCNKFTIAQMDTKNSSITVAVTSKN